MEHLKNGDPDHDYVIDEISFHLQKAQEALTEGLPDPRAWRERGEHGDRVLAQALPLLVALSSLSTNSEESRDT